MAAYTAKDYIEWLNLMLNPSYEGDQQVMARNQLGQGQTTGPYELTDPGVGGMEWFVNEAKDTGGNKSWYGLRDKKEIKGTEQRGRDMTAMLSDMISKQAATNNKKSR